MCERKTGGGLSFFQKWFNVFHYHRASGKYGFSTKCIQNVSRIFVNRWLKWYWSVFDLFCCCSNAFLCLPQHFFFSFYFFKSDRIITGIESWVTNLFPDLNPFPLVLVGKLTKIVLVSLLKHYLTSCFISTNTYVCLRKRTQWIFIIIYLFTDEAGCKGVLWFGIILWLHQRNYGSGIYMVECQGLDITLLRLPYSYNSKILSECIFILYVVAGA